MRLNRIETGLATRPQSSGPLSGEAVLSYFARAQLTKYLGRYASIYDVNKRHVNLFIKFIYYCNFSRHDKQDNTFQSFHSLMITFLSKNLSFNSLLIFLLTCHSKHFEFEGRSQKMVSFFVKRKKIFCDRHSQYVYYNILLSSLAYYDFFLHRHLRSARPD